MKSTLYSSPLRPPHERQAALIWAACAVACLSALVWMQAAGAFAVGMAAVCALLALGRWRQALPLMRRQRALAGPPMRFLTPEELRVKMAARPDCTWFGSGFAWEQLHAQLAHELVTEQFPHLALAVGQAQSAQRGKGAGFLHGLGAPEERDLYVPTAHLAGHLLVVGTTGAGKTRLMDILATQCILRDEAVVVFDPKGDRDLAASLERSCRAAGSPDRFVYFHPANPAASALINPLSSFSRQSELASRIAALIPSASAGDPFRAFGWMAMNKVITGLLATRSSPDLVAIRRLLEMGPDQLLKAVLEQHLDKVRPGWRAKVSAADKANHELRAYAAIYRALPDELQDTDIDGLVNMVEHNREHFGKMVASLIPVLTMLTTGPMRELLSPARAPEGDTRRRTDMRAVITERKVVYIALDSLSDAVVGSAIGSMLLSDLAAVAGDIYNRHGGGPQVNVFVDEAAEVINDPTIQLLNKGRGAGFRLTVLTQTLADLEVRLGSTAKARMALGNLNNQLILRTTDGGSQKYLAENMPETVLYTIERSQSTSSGTGEPSAFSGSFTERSTQTTTPLISGPTMGLLPDLHYFVKIGGSATYKGVLPILREAQA